MLLRKTQLMLLAMVIGVGVLLAQESPPKRGTIPITIHGRAVDANGKLIGGTTVYLVSANGGESSLVATTATDDDGRYQFENVALPAKMWEGHPLAGGFQICGVAAGHGFAWHYKAGFVDGSRPAKQKIRTMEDVFYRDDVLVMDLVFGPPAALQGRITNEDGKPLPNIAVRVDYCDYLCLPPERLGPESGFNGITALPDVWTVVKTDADGRFILRGLPREMGFRLQVHHADYADLDIYWASTPRLPRGRIRFNVHPAPGRDNPIVTGEVQLTLIKPRVVSVQCVDDKSGLPAPGRTVNGSQNGMARSGAYGVTDAAGQVQLRLPPGRYVVTADLRHNQEVLRTSKSLVVSESSAEQSIVVRVKSPVVPNSPAKPLATSEN